MREVLVIQTPKNLNWKNHGQKWFFVFGEGEAGFLKEILSVRSRKALEGDIQKNLTIYSRIKKSS
jgi:hypothetical protein